MKKEKWMLGEIDAWEKEELISSDVAETLKSRYVPKKNMGLLTVLFSIIGTVFIGLGIILIGANNWWYALPTAVRTVIAFLPLLLSQALIIYTHLKKRESTAFREGAAILNSAGIFSTVALIHQIFHIPVDLSDYLLICGILTFPSMVLINAVSPLIVCYWAALNGGFCLEGNNAPLITLFLFIPCIVYSVTKFKEENAKSLYLAILTAISVFIYILTATIFERDNFSLILLSFMTLLSSLSFLYEKTGRLYKALSMGGTIITMFTLSTIWLWEDSDAFLGALIPVLTAVIMLSALFAEGVKIKKEKTPSLAFIPFTVFIVRGIWLLFGLDKGIAPTVFMIIMNLLLLALSVYFITIGVKRVSLIYSNVGMISFCYLVLIRFLDVDLPLLARGFIFLFLGIGFLLFNLYLTKAKKAKEAEAK